MTSTLHALLSIAMAAVLFGCQAPATDVPIQTPAPTSPTPDERVAPTPADPLRGVDDPTEPVPNFHDGVDDPPLPVPLPPKPGPIH